jgi:hypothetical protein
MRRLAILVVMVGVMMFAIVPIASAHVHAFTPLGCLSTDNPNSGAVVGFVEAADAAGPMHGDTPIVPWNASGKLPSGGEGAANACA